MINIAKKKSFYEKLENKANDMTDIKKLKLLIFLGVLLIIIAILNIVMGAAKISVPGVARLLFVDDGSVQRQIIYNVRLPRAIIAGLVGICLSLSGAILQGVMRNSLASPSIIGVTSGASFMGYVLLVMAPQYARFLPMGAFLGALATTLIIYTISFKDGANPMRLVLSGIAISSLLGAASDLIRMFYSNRLDGITGFLIGGLNGRTWVDLKLMLPYAIVGILITILMPRKLNVLMLGDQVAISLGLNTEKTRLFFIVVSSLLSAAAVSVVGIIGFVGMIVPHIGRMLIGSDYKYLLPATTILGATVLLACDLIGRTFFSPIEIPVGIIMSALGAPFFLYLLRTRKVMTGNDA